MSAHHLPEAAVVLMDAATGRLLVYASHVDKGPARDLCVEATAPSASVFKIVTAAALIEDAHLEPDTKQCYSGGESRINAVDLVEDPQRDRWCTTLAGALGRSINTVFARLASEHLAPPQLDAMARRFGYGQGVPFDVPVQPSAVHVPTEPLEFARTAAGFWNSTLSPMQAVEMSAIVARGGEAVRPAIVDKVVSSRRRGPLVGARRAAVAPDAGPRDRRPDHGHDGADGPRGHELARVPRPARRRVPPGHRGRRQDGHADRRRSAPLLHVVHGLRARAPAPPARQVAVAALVVNGPEWQVKANVIAREVLRAYFVSQGSEGVTRPSLAAVASRPTHHSAR